MRKLWFIRISGKIFARKNKVEFIPHIIPNKNPVLNVQNEMFKILEEIRGES